MKKFASAPVRIPVKLVNGKWEYLYGSDLPLKDGAVGELLVEKTAISDERFVDMFQERTEHKILESGTPLLVALSLPPDGNLVDYSLYDYLVPPNSVAWSGSFYDVLRSRTPHIAFVEVRVDGPTMWMRQNGYDDGVWLVVQGMQTKAVLTSPIIVPRPVSEEPLDSLNQAFTRISEKYETWRKSHTGNIYERVFFQRPDGKWYPLDVLRDEAIATHKLQVERKLATHRPSEQISV